MTTPAIVDGSAASGGGERRPLDRALPKAPGLRADFDRDIVPVLGLPFDAVTLEQAVQRIRAHAFARSRCFISTPNLNFVFSALSDPSFRDTVLRSDLSLVDGMPLVWVARWCGTPVPGRVAGADVFEALQAHGGPPIKVYLFGGAAGAAAEACDAINRRGGGMRCVGFDPAGFGSIESMSSDAQIERINRSGADFLVASLGAKKGQAWLEYNAPRLEAPVLAHLGAALNFTAGTVRRAPAWMRWSGIEWLWRIKEEPTLWRRYWRDGTLMLGVLLVRVLPDIVLSASQRRQATPGRAPTVDLQRGAGGSTLRLGGLWTDATAALLRTPLAQAAAHGGFLRIDLAQVDDVSSAFVGLMLVAKGWFGARGGFKIVDANAAVTATLRRKLVAHTLLADAEGR